MIFCSRGIFHPDCGSYGEISNDFTVKVRSLRFAKLQDYMAEKLFPAVVNILANTQESLSYIDILNTLEKNHILVSATKWRELRNLRNKIAHEYPNAYQEQCETLDKIMDCFAYLESTLNIIKTELKKYERTS